MVNQTRESRGRTTRRGQQPRLWLVQLQRGGREIGSRLSSRDTRNGARRICSGTWATAKAIIGVACKCLQPGCQCYCCVIGLLLATIGVMWVMIKYYQWRLGDDGLAVLLRAAG